MSGEDDHIQLAITKSRQARASRAQTEDDPLKNVIGVTGDKELLQKIKDVSINIGRGSADGFTKIQKVPEIMLRNEEFKEYFEPRELSIGPIHAANTKLFKRELKLKLAAHFIKVVGKTGDVLLEQIKTEFKDIKTCFDEEVIKSYTDDGLICLLFLDGCAMLGFIDSFVKQKLNEFNISNGQAAFIQQDLFLAENQIPFKVLDILMGMGSQPIYKWPIDNIRKDTFRFIIASNITNFPRDLKDLKRIFRKIHGDRKPVHLLDVLRDVITADCVFTFSCLSIIKFLLKFLCSCGLVVLPKICRCICSAVCKDCKNWSKKQSFRNVQELKTAGIKFMPSKNTLRDISFHSRCFNISGQLKLPTLVIHNSTQHMLLNMVAHEMCLSVSNPDHDPWITSYVNLLDLLIDNEHDVKDLRAVDILRNCLSSDIEASLMINRIGSYCFAPSKDTYACIKKQIQKHHRRRCAIWMAQACHAHFSSPWSIVALFAATAVLVLTAIQTWCALKQNEGSDHTSTNRTAVASGIPKLE